MKVITLVVENYLSTEGFKNQKDFNLCKKSATFAKTTMSIRH